MCMNAELNKENFGVIRFPMGLLLLHTKHVVSGTTVGLSIIWLKKIKSVAYSSQGSQTGQLNFCNWLADDITTG